MYKLITTDDSVTTMCCSPVRHHLATGLKNGEVKVFMGEPCQSAVAPYTITDTKVKVYRIGGTLIWQLARNLCFAELILVVNDRSYDSSTLVYT